MRVLIDCPAALALLGSVGRALCRAFPHPCGARVRGGAQRTLTVAVCRRRAVPGSKERGGSALAPPSMLLPPQDLGQHPEFGVFGAEEQPKEGPLLCCAAELPVACCPVHCACCTGGGSWRGGDAAVSVPGMLRLQISYLRQQLNSLASSPGWQLLNPFLPPLCWQQAGLSARASRRRRAAGSLRHRACDLSVQAAAAAGPDPLPTRLQEGTKRFFQPGEAAPHPARCIQLSCTKRSAVAARGSAANSCWRGVPSGGARPSLGSSLQQPSPSCATSPCTPWGCAEAAEAGARAPRWPPAPGESRRHGCSASARPALTAAAQLLGQIYYPWQKA